tara:strand:- start:476 stop:1228 length:753 start_codon:yes stop_codon:yes gene_type:complete
MNYYQHHIGDFNNATRHLTRVERSLYRDLIELYYDKEQPLTSDEKRLARLVLAVTNDEKAALKSVIEEFFTLSNDFYHNSRCDLELDKYRANNSAKARAGKASADARRKAKEQLNQYNLTGVEQVLNSVQTKGQQNPTNQEPRTNNQEPVTKEKKTSRFAAPTIDEVQEYSLSKKLNTAGFHDYYESNGWRVGKNKMKDWKASARGWSGRNNARGNSNATHQRTGYKNAAESMHDTLKKIAAEADEQEMG